jgi:hypothetical protein
VADDSANLARVFIWVTGDRSNDRIGNRERFEKHGLLRERLIDGRDG